MERTLGSFPPHMANGSFFRSDGRVRWPSEHTEELRRVPHLQDLISASEDSFLFLIQVFLFVVPAFEINTHTHKGANSLFYPTISHKECPAARPGQKVHGERSPGF